MSISFEELSQIARDHSQMWPSDLVEGLEENDPHVCFQSQMYANLIAQKKREQQKELLPLLPSLVVPGWNNVKNKGQKNWADFENLLFFYALGKLQLDSSYQTVWQKENDLNALRYVIEKFPTLKGKKTESAEKRILKNTTYLKFGRRVIDSLISDDVSAQYDLNREIQDAEETNYFNASKLRKSQTIANRVFRTLRDRYPTKA